jgi:hypothetical protein
MPSALAAGYADRAQRNKEYLTVHQRYPARDVFPPYTSAASVPMNGRLR